METGGQINLGTGLASRQALPGPQEDFAKDEQKPAQSTEQCRQNRRRKPKQDLETPDRLQGKMLGGQELIGKVPLLRGKRRRATRHAKQQGGQRPKHLAVGRNEKPDQK